MTTHSILYRELQMRFSQFEAFYPRHVQCRITLAVRVLAPLESLINILSNDRTNSMFLFFDM